MRSSAIIFLIVVPAFWAQTPVPPSPAATPQSANFEQMRECSNRRSVETCAASQDDLKKAAQEFARALKLQKEGKPDEAIFAFQEAARLVPRDMEYVTAHEVARQQGVLRHIEAGNNFLAAGKKVEANAEFRMAVQLDPTNRFAVQRLQEAIAPITSSAGLQTLRVTDDFGELRVVPRNIRQNFHVKGDARTVYAAIGNAFGVAFQFDDPIELEPVRFDLEDADFYTAAKWAGFATKTFWVPLSPHQALVAADNPTNHQELDRMSARTFYIPDVVGAQDLADVANLLRTMFSLHTVSQSAADNSISVRGPRAMLDAATLLLQTLDEARPQVMLEFQVYEVSESLVRNLGLDMPLQWQMFSLNAAALAALQTPATRDLINQLISSGSINQANSSAISALLAQLQNQNSNPLLKTPFGTFGGGHSRFAVPFPPTTINFSHNQSRVESLQHITLRAGHGEAENMKIGSRFPILNATFAPIFNTPAVSQVLANNSFVAPFPSFNYEDIGITIKATPRIQGDKAVTLDLDLQIRGLGSQNFNGVPVITNRQYTGSLMVANDEPAIVAGVLDISEQDSLQGIPGLVHVPGLGRLTSQQNKQRSATELLVMITPHITRIKNPPPDVIIVPQIGPEGGATSPRGLP